MPTAPTYTLESQPVMPAYNQSPYPTLYIFNDPHVLFNDTTVYFNGENIS